MVLLQSGAASRCVGQNGIKLGRINCINVVSGERFGLTLQPGMQMKRTTTVLLTGNHNLAPVRLQNPYCSLVQPCKRNVGDASGQERNAVSPFAFGRESLSDL